MALTKGSVLITGANGGLGSAFITALSRSPYGNQYRGLYTVRNPSAAHDLYAALKTSPEDHKSEVIALDLSSLKNVRRVAEDINTRVKNGTLEPLCAVVLNAAFQNANLKVLVPQDFTDEGYEATFGINYLAHFLFVLLILGSMDKEHGRIVIVSSWMHDSYDSRNNSQEVFKPDQYKLMFTDTEGLAKGITYEDDGYKAGMRRYGVSKLLMVMFMYELQRRIDIDPILSKLSVLSLDPGAMGGTGLTKTSPAFIRFITGWLIFGLQDIAVRISPNGFMRPPWKSAQDLLMAAFDEKTLGQYPKAWYFGGSAKAESSKESKDTEKQKRLWIDSLKLAGIQEGDTVLQQWQ